MKKKTATRPTPETIASMFGASTERVRAQFAKNAEQLRAMESKARETGKKVNGYTADRLAELAAMAEAKAGNGA